MFIELTTRDKECKRLVNVDNIIFVRAHPDDGTIVETSEGVIIVKESYEDVKKMVTTIPLVIDTPGHLAVGEIDQLYEDADNGICSNEFYVPIEQDSKDLDRLRAKIFRVAGLPSYLLNNRKSGDTIVRIKDEEDNRSRD